MTQPGAPRRARRRPSAATSTACSTRSAFAPESCLGGGFLDAPWDDVAVALQVSAYSLEGARGRGAAAHGRRAARSSGSTSTTARAVARLRLDGRGEGRARVDRARSSPATSGPQGIRVNLVAAGPSAQPRGPQHPGLRAVRGRLERAGPARLGHQGRRPRRQGACVALLSDWFPATTGEIIHVDGGFHAIGA